MKKYRRLLPLLLLTSCIELSVYTPVPDYPDDKSSYKMEVEDNGFRFRKIAENENYPDYILVTENKRPDFAFHSPCLNFLENRDIRNLYGNLSLVIARGIAEHPDYFFAHNKGGLEISINSFSLNSNDSCFHNEIKLSMNADIYLITDQGRVTRDFIYTDEIHSHVTDFYIFSVLWTIPAIIESGFRGNRQDQMNDITKNMLLNFSAKLKDVLHNSSSPDNKEDSQL